RRFPGGSALARGATGWVLVEDDPGRALGAAILWAGSRGIGELHLLVADAGVAGMRARRGDGFGRAPRVGRVGGSVLGARGVAPAGPELRRPASAPHPYQRLAPERWLRCRVVAEPSLVGAEHLAPVPALAPADDLRKPRPAPAAGIDREGRPLLAVCSTGFDV